MMFNRLLTQLCDRAVALGEVLDICQIGANDGRINDPIYDIIRSFPDSTRILLIEPQNEVIPYLAENYSYHPAATIWAGAIGAQNEIGLFRLKPTLHDRFVRRHLQDSPAYRVPTGFSSTVREHVVRHVAGNLPDWDDPADAIEEVRVPCSRLSPLLRSLDWPGRGVDVLQIDTEGADDLTIYVCDLEHLRPVLVNFEHVHLPSQRSEKLAEYLSDLGYMAEKYHSMNCLAIHRDKGKAFGLI